MIRILVVLLFGLFVFACTQEKTPEPVPQNSVKTAQVQTLNLLSDPIELQRFEWTPQVLIAWRSFADSKPTLLLLSNDPLLQPVPEALRAEVAEKLKEADLDLLAECGSMRRADPLLLRDMTLDAALRAGYFARVVWAIPQLEGGAQVDAKALGLQLSDAGLATPDEAASLHQVGPLVEGRLRDTPFTVGSLSALQTLNGPVVVHIDPSYYEKLYRNEIRTPLLPLVKTSLEQLKALQFKSLGLSYADANLDMRFALDGRYLGDFLAMMIADPQKLGEELPEIWKGQAEILYLKNFMQKEKIAQITKQMVTTEPNSAWVRFTLFRAAQESDEGETALQALAEAVRLDPVYALEYENLAEQAYDKGRPDAALQMLQLATETFPDNPLIRLKIAQLSSELGDRKTALHLVAQLQRLPWSPVYYPEMPDYLKGFAAHLEGKKPAVSP
ncbi:hypothetical protein DSOUD_0686 [Desulfuromonas soudanensis]|uniref:Uncharacterized protein n=1 Tax=Desulfuromonas soudanensis TaxID=1603606 RepID=A0A0M5IVE2_9BACT|nr:hypothetical protein [Desulfuromonas soudanensis]ALC15474.1 hypothetical protein DSOUD_0686 [Desulfuromonas soudanensis]